MKRWFSIIIPILLLSSPIGWRLQQKKAEVQGQAQMKSARMKVPAVANIAVAHREDIVRTFEATGSVEAPMNVKIAPKITGRIEYIGVEEGDRVHKGQVLVRIDNSDVEAQVQSAMAAVAEAKYRLAQAQMGENSNDVGVNTQIRQVQADVSSAEADYNQMKENKQAQIATAESALADAQSRVDNAKASLNSAQANFANAKTKYDRVYNLYKLGYVAAQDVDDEKAGLTVQESAVDIAKAQVKSAQTQVTSAEQHLKIVKAQQEADIEAARAKLEQARASLEHAKANTSQKSAYRQSIEALRASVAAAQASLRSAESKRQDTILVSPMDGYVTTRTADVGSITSPTQPILSVQFMKSVWVSIAVPEQESTKLHLGQTAKVTIDAFQERVFDASVIQINPSADPESRQFTIRLVISNKDNLLKPGMFARVSLITERIPDQLVVPREAVQKGKEGTVVVTIGKDNKAKRVPVITGPEDEDSISIVNGVNLGDRIVALSAMPVRDGQMVVPGGGKHRGGRQHGAKAR